MFKPEERVMRFDPDARIVFATDPHDPSTLCCIPVNPVSGPPDSHSGPGLTAPRQHRATIRVGVWRGSRAGPEDLDPLDTLDREDILDAGDGAESNAVPPRMRRYGDALLTQHENS